MAVKVQKLFQVVSLAKRLGFSNLPTLEHARKDKERLGLVLVCDSFEGAIIRHVHAVEAEIFAPNPPARNVGGDLWEEGYEIKPERQGKKVVFRVRWVVITKNKRGKKPKEKWYRLIKTFPTLTDAGIAALSHFKKEVYDG